MKIALLVVRALRGLLAPLLALLMRPPIAGALYVLFIAARRGGLSLRALPKDVLAREEVLAFTRIAGARFHADTVRVSIAIAAAAVVVGACLGFAAAMLVRLRDRVVRRGARSPGRFAFVAFVVTVSMHSWLTSYAMALRPQLYASAWYARGGLRRTLQILATDVLGVRGVLVVGLLALAVFFAGPVAKWRFWPGRLRRAFFPSIGRANWRRAAPAASAIAITSVASLGATDSPGANAAAAHSEALPALEDRPNVLLFAIDALRADRLTPRVAPNLAALADRGTRFDRAYTSLPRAMPSWVTVLTGRYPHHHGVRSSLPSWDDRTRDFDALASRLAHVGYRTSVASDEAGDAFARVDLGFTHVSSPALDLRELARARVLEGALPALPWLFTGNAGLARRVFPATRALASAPDVDGVVADAVRAIDDSRGGPFFLTVSLSVAREVSSVPGPYYARFCTHAYRGRFKYGAPLEGPAPDAEDIAQIRCLYDGAVASVDAAAGRVLDALRGRALDHTTIIAVVSDHGEALFEGGRGAGHGENLLGDESGHIALAIFDPRRPEAHREARIARDVDVAATLYDLTDVPEPSDLDGRSLAPAMAGAPIEDALAYAESEPWQDDGTIAPEYRLPTAALAQSIDIDAAHGLDVGIRPAALASSLVARERMVRDARFKLVYFPSRAGATYVLFDTERDPEERHDVSSEHPAELARLRSELWKWMLRDPQMTEHHGLLVAREKGAAR